MYKHSPCIMQETTAIFVCNVTNAFALTILDICYYLHKHILCKIYTAELSNPVFAAKLRLSYGKDNVDKCF